MVSEFCESGYTRETKWTDLIKVYSYSSQLSQFISVSQLFMRGKGHTSCCSQAHMAHGGSHIVDTYTQEYLDGFIPIIF